ncbi:deaminase [bacterium]|nr:deaminase [bacterium]
MKVHPIGKDRLIIAFTGSLGSGVTTAAKHLVKTLPSKVYKVTGDKWDEKPQEEIGGGAYRLSRLIEEEAGKNGEKRNSKGEFDRKLLQRLGNELRRKDIGYLSRTLLERIEVIEGKIGGKSEGPIIIDGIKNSGEVAYLRKFSNFFLFAIDTPKEIRWERVKEKYGGMQSNFDDDDERDHDENIDYGQQVDKCVYLSDILVNNDSDIKKELYVKIDFYVSLIGKSIPYTYPVDQETIMTQAYCVSQKSSCLKRKVAAILVSDDGIPIVSVCNEVPLPEKSCEIRYGMCYRDKVKIDLIKNLKYCPKCSETILQSIKCPKCGNSTTINELSPKCNACKIDLDLDSSFICPKCEAKIIKEFIGKRMEVCRALHAEERALLQLSKLGMGLPLKNLTMTLYTTTFPCPQCANKIVETGIKKIIYVEPYPSKESKDLLVNGLGMENIERFEGVKAGAYFKIYDRTQWKK